MFCLSAENKWAIDNSGTIPVVAEQYYDTVACLLFKLHRRCGKLMKPNAR